MIFVRFRIPKRIDCGRFVALSHTGFRPEIVIKVMIKDNNIS